MSVQSIVLSFLALGALVLSPQVAGQAIISTINSLATQKYLPLPSAAFSPSAAVLPVSGQLVPNTLPPVFPPLLTPVVQSEPTIVVPIVPNYGYAIPTLPPAPPAVGCGCGNGYSFLRKCTVLPPFL